MSSEQRPAATVAATAATGGNVLLDRMSRTLVETIEPMLDVMFGACDDLFFDLASRAKSNQEQTRYFETLREVRNRKTPVTADFGRRLGESFAWVGKRGAKGFRERNPLQADAESLELVATEQMEKDAVIIDMVSRARQEWQQELFQLHERLQVLAGRKFTDPDDPLDPGRIMRAFVLACQPVDVELKSIKTLYRQFDRYVLRNLEEPYFLLNQMMIDARVLPNLTQLARRKARTYDLPQERDKKPADTRGAGGAGGGSEGGGSGGGGGGGGSGGGGSGGGGSGGGGGGAGLREEGLADGIGDASPEMRELAQLLRRMRSGGIRMPMFPDLPGAQAGPPIARDELISLLSDVEEQTQTRAEGDADGGEQQPLDIRRAIEAIIASRGQLRVGQADEDVINVVAMFFDLILDDRNLPIEIQALVSRLQIPILKVALRDRSFFTERKHPARMLINEIARTSIGWEASTKDAQDALFIRLTELVEEVLRNSSDHAGVFEKCLGDLLGFIERNEQRVAKVERRTEEKAQAEARTARARDMVRHVLQERLEGKELPTAITAFLLEDWQQVLQLVFLRQGKDSPEWIDVVQTVDDLVWSVHPHQDEKSHARLVRLLPDLYQRMSAGLEQTHSNIEQARARIDVIRQIHAMLDDSTVVGVEPPVLVAPLTPEQQEQITPVIPPEEKSWRDMTAVERQKVQYEALMYEYLKRVDEVPVGSWFEYDDLRRAVTRRCKLSTRIEDTRTFIFVNRLGMQVFEKPRKAFAYDLQMRHARPIEDAPLFDRTIERIAANLRKLAGEAWASMEHIGLALFTAGALAYLVLTVVVLLRRSRVFDAGSAAIATSGLALWQGTLAWHTVDPLPGQALLAIEIARAAVLLLYIARTLRAATGNWPARAATSVTLMLAVLMPVVIGWAVPLIGGETDDFTQRRAWSGLFVAIGLLIALEQLFRNAVAPLALVRYASIALGVTVVYDLYLFSDTLIFERLDVDQWRARGGINALAAVFLATAIARNRVTRAVSFSRNVVFYTASLTAAGLFLLAISVLGYAIRRFGGSWGSVLQLMLFFSAVLLLMVAALSQRLRDRIRVYVSKNFFTLRYDYRQEWLQLIAELSGKLNQDDLFVRAIRVLADLYKCPGGALWLRQGSEFVPAVPCRMKLPESCDESVDSAFCRKLAQEWIFEIDVKPNTAIELPPVPGWITRVTELGIFVPLLVEQELIGFIGLQRSLGFATLDWEDLEILKTAARQVASDVARVHAAEQLARARQFDTYHQLTAFIMHDLKNLIAQQELVVKNAAKHKENPAFVEDAINTIQNSVARMSALLGKLQQREPSERRPVELQEVLIDALRKCESLRPKPALRIEQRDLRVLRVLSDHDHLVMILSHIIKNAQEATREDGFVDVTLRQTERAAVIEVEDNGSGMDAEFVRTRLFKPFESTKAGKGMGIGAFQAREFIRSLGGEIHVTSKPGAGTTFTLSIPLATAPAELLAGSMNR